MLKYCKIQAMFYIFSVLFLMFSLNLFIIKDVILFILNHIHIQWSLYWVSFYLSSIFLFMYSNLIHVLFHLIYPQSYFTQYLFIVTIIMLFIICYYHVILFRVILAAMCLVILFRFPLVSYLFNFIIPYSH